MALAPDDRALITETLEREPTDAEVALFENLWSEHCAYRSSRPLLSAFHSDGEDVIVGPGDDAAVVRLSDEWYLAFGIESHNHPSYVDPYDGAATGVGGIVRDILSMGAYPIALTDSLYFGSFEDEHALYLFEGVVEGIADYGNAIGVPTVGGSVHFDPGYEGNPLVNVACLGLLRADRLLRAAATDAGNKLVIVGNATGRDGLGGASFASEDLSADAKTEDRPAVQVGDPYTEKLLIEANEVLLDEGLIEAGRDLGAAGLGGATSEMVAKGGLGARLELGQLHQREPNMNGLEILLAESQERMCYEVTPEHVEDVRRIADRFELGSSVIGSTTADGQFHCRFDGETIVNIPATFLGDGAPTHDLSRESSPESNVELPDLALEDTLEGVLASPNTGAKEWVFTQYDHEVGVRTARRPGDDAAIMAIPETGAGVAITAGSEPKWTTAAPYEGARAVALETATNLAVKGADPHAVVDCLNGGNPEQPSVYDGFAQAVDGIADMCKALDVPVVGGNVSLYNDSPAGPIPPTPTLAMIGVTAGYDAPPRYCQGGGGLVLIGPVSTDLGGSEVLAQAGGHDEFPSLPSDPYEVIERIQQIATLDSTLATHDISHGGIAVTGAEMVSSAHGATIELSTDIRGLVSERPGRILLETTDVSAVKAACGDVLSVTEIGHTTDNGRLRLACADGGTSYTHEELSDLRGTIAQTLK